MYKSPDEQPLVPPVMRKLQSVKFMVSRPPKSTVHGVINQFGQLHYQRSAVDRVLSSVGNLFRRICNLDGRTIRLLDDYQCGDVEEFPNDNPGCSQKAVSRVKEGENYVDKSKDDDHPFLMMLKFKDANPNMNVTNFTSAHCEARIKKTARCSSASNKKWLQVCSDHLKTVSKFADNMEDNCQNLGLAQDSGRTSTQYSRLPHSPYTTHRGFNISKIFRKAENVQVEESYEEDCRKECIVSPTLYRRLDNDIRPERFDSKHLDSSASSLDHEGDTRLESVWVSFLRRSSSCTSIIRSQSDLAHSVCRKCHNLKQSTRTCDSDVARISRAGNKTTRFREVQGLLHSMSDTSVVQCRPSTLTTTSNQLPWKHLTASTEDQSRNLDYTFRLNTFDNAVVNGEIKWDLLPEHKS